MELPWCKEKLFGACETLFQVQGTHQGPCLHGVSQAISKCNHFWKLQMPGRQRDSGGVGVGGRQPRKSIFESRISPKETLMFH